MNYSEIIEFIGGTSIVVAGIAWVARGAINHMFSRELEVYKATLEKTNNEALATHVANLTEKNQRVLHQLQGDQARSLALMQKDTDRQLEILKATQIRMQKLEDELLRNRGKGYEKIWMLTGSLNLFGSTQESDGQELSEQLKDWYFEHGRVLTSPSKTRYFLVQEILNFVRVKSIILRRPADEQLFASSQRPLEVLRVLQSEFLNIPIRGDEDVYSLDDLQQCVSTWKAHTPDDIESEAVGVEAWVLTQFLLSAFRTGMAEELGSRDSTQEITATDSS